MKTRQDAQTHTSWVVEWSLFYSGASNRGLARGARHGTLPVVVVVVVVVDQRPQGNYFLSGCFTDPEVSKNCKYLEPFIGALCICWGAR
jgi:hypothetical protein